MSRHDRTTRTGQDRANLYDEITDKIIAELEAGRFPWVQPWGKSTAIWLTYRPAAALGGNVREGERGTTVVYADRFVPEDEKRRARETGEEAQAIPFLKRFTVFNTAQCERLPDDMVIATPPPLPGLIEPRVEALIRATGIDFRIGGDRAFYVPADDYVVVPPPQAYFEPINWHRTALHEIGHASGHHSRLNRDFSTSFGTKKYAFEELIAEMSAAFCCASLGIVPTVRHADYIGSWLEVLREDNRAIVRAASQASKAADWILSFLPEAETTDPGSDAIDRRAA
ncbi:MAG: antirestriction protein ArdC [Rhizobiales bacterium 12-66-7]|nr:MAG: antirestriction protein ArdC [Rhizobiales bacterium 12-66-7]